MAYRSRSNSDEQDQKKHYKNLNQQVNDFVKQQNILKPPIQQVPQIEQIQFTKKFLDSTHNHTQEEVDKYRAEMKIQIISAGKNIPEPFITWEDGQFPDYVTQVFERANFFKPTPIQAQCIPIVLHGHDLIGVAQTGSGKTLAFLQPAIIHINAQPQVKRGEGPIVLVLTPTRELAMQIEGVVQQLGDLCNIQAACIYGGADKYSQKQKLKSGVDIVVATPGRLIMFLEQMVTDLRRTTYLILDEADRMLDMGFDEQIRKIVGQIRKDRQTLLFTATWPKKVMQLGRDLCQQEPIHIQIGKQENTVNKDIKQHFKFVSKYDKEKAIKKECANLKPLDKALVFCKTKKSVDQIFRIIQRERVRAIHGDKSQHERDYTIGQFKDNKIQMLVATDVASRGLDIKDITLVINYDMANTVEDYIHRIGRTGRAGNKGESLTFFDLDDDCGLASDLIEVLQSKQNIPQELYTAKANKNAKKQSKQNDYYQHSSKGSYNSYGKSNYYQQPQNNYHSNNYQQPNNYGGYQKW